MSSAQALNSRLVLKPVHPNQCLRLRSGLCGYLWQVYACEYMYICILKEHPSPCLPLQSVLCGLRLRLPLRLRLRLRLRLILHTRIWPPINDRSIPARAFPCNLLCVCICGLCMRVNACTHASWKNLYAGCRLRYTCLSCVNVCNLHTCIKT
jgi:hypothetical protein